MEWLTPTEIFGEKGQPAKVVFFFHFYRNNQNFLYHLFAAVKPGSDMRITSLHLAGIGPHIYLYLDS